jgi:HEAT repeat protein
MTIKLRVLGAGVVALVVASIPARGQTIERRVSSAPSGNISFNFASRSTACGDGRYYFRVDGEMWSGNFNEFTRNQPCERGPVRVLLVRDGRELLRIQTFVGPLSTDTGATNLGSVPSREAADYLLGIATRADGRPARDALTPALLADSAIVARDLLTLARDPLRPRELRRSALSWLVRRRGEMGMSAAEVSRTLSTIARDETENRDVRQQAIASLARLETAEALASIVDMSQQTSDTWLATRSVHALASSGDPRARQHVRAAAERTDLSEEARVAAISGLAGEYSTSRDATFLRDLYRKVNSDRLRDAAMSGAAQIGGGETRDWLLTIARSPDEPIRNRRKAIELGDRVGMTAADLSTLYDRIDDNEVRAQIINELAQNGTRVATDKLIAIAKNDPSVSNRRRAVQALGKFDDPRVREALKDLVQRI